MAIHRCLITLHTEDANPANFITNTLYFDDDEDSGTNLPLIAAEVIEKYGDIDAFFSPLLAEDGHDIEFYRMSDPTPRVPVYSDTWNFPGSLAVNTEPPEVALVLSFQGAKSSGVNQASRRGRIYLGPFGNSTDIDGRPSSTLINAVAGFGSTLLADSNLADWTWVVFSPTLNGAVPVTNGWVDNSWDTQRRRGIEWTSRETYGVL